MVVVRVGGRGDAPVAEGEEERGCGGVRRRGVEEDQLPKGERKEEEALEVASLVWKGIEHLFSCGVGRRSTGGRGVFFSTARSIVISCKTRIAYLY